MNIQDHLNQVNLKEVCLAITTALVFKISLVSIQFTKKLCKMVKISQNKCHPKKD